MLGDPDQALPPKSRRTVRTAASFYGKGKSSTEAGSKTVAVNADGTNAKQAHPTVERLVRIQIRRAQQLHL